MCPGKTPQLEPRSIARNPTSRSSRTASTQPCLPPALAETGRTTCTALFHWESPYGQRLSCGALKNPNLRAPPASSACQAPAQRARRLRAKTTLGIRAPLHVRAVQLHDARRRAVARKDQRFPRVESIEHTLA